ncbi:hypothetical protein [Jannaschia formosa]|uniref:hypothetical protein n=1 Tax=Jannaschia formosa TaxID=2259592 RepID=UPI000E1BFDE8|nr:hypothetical protein [Jannaschia formosa]TFL17131.1 hypothetical protein DR046_16465 [Jannaschia formosa]
MLGIGTSLTASGAGQGAAGVPPQLADLGWATVEGVTASGTDQSGVAYVVVPAGTAEVGLAGDLGGAQIDPVRTGGAYGATQGYDGRITGSYDAGLAAAFPAAMGAGQVLVRGRRLDPVVGPDGFLEGFDVLHVLSREPGADEILSSAVGWTGRGAPEILPFDAPARLAELATWDAAGLAFPAYGTLMAALEKYPLVFGQNSHTASHAGYERLTPSGADGSPGVGYAFSVARVQVVALFALTADPSPYTPAERLALYRRIVRIGLDTVEPILGSGAPLPGDGGHNQAGIAFGIEALRATGRTDRIAGFRAGFGGSLGQYFRIDQAFLDTQLVPHDDLTRNCLSRRRTLGDQGAAGAGEVMVPARFGGAGGVHGDWYQVNIPPGSVLTRESDGATAIVRAETDGSHTAFPNLSGNKNVDVPFRLRIDAQPATPFAAGDVVHIQWPPGVWELGAAAWALRGLARPSYVTPSAENDYTTLRSEGAQALWLDMQGLLPANMRDVLDFAGWADADPAWPLQWGSGSANLGTGDIGAHVWRNVLGNAPAPDTPGTYDPVSLYASSEMGMFAIPDATGVTDSASGSGTPTLDGMVGALLDRSPNGRIGRAYNTVNRPIWRQTAGGLHYLEFDGTDDFMEIGNLAWTNTGYTLVAAVSLRSFKATDHIVDADGSPRVAQLLSLSAGVPRSIAFNTAGEAFSANGAHALTANTPCVLTGMADYAGNVVCRIDGVAGTPVAFAGTGQTASTDKFFIGRRSTTYSAIDLYGFALIDRPMTPTELADAEGYMAERMPA